MAALEVSERQSSTNRGPANNIRYSDVAHYVGVSLAAKDPTQTKTPKRSQPNSGRGQSLPAAAPPVSTTLVDPSTTTELSRVESLPTIQANRADRLRCQLEWLKAEQRAEKEHLLRLESSLSDSMLMERKAQKRVAKNKVMRDFHQQRVQDVEVQISMLRGELQSSHRSAPMSPGRGAPSPTAASQQELVERLNATRLPPGNATIKHAVPDPASVSGSSLALNAADSEVPAPSPQLRRTPPVLPPLEVIDPDEYFPMEEQDLGGSRRQTPATSSTMPMPKSKSAPSFSASSELRKKVKTASTPGSVQTPSGFQMLETQSEVPDEKRSRSTPGTPQSRSGVWMRSYLRAEGISPRSAKWQPANPEEKIHILLDAARLRTEGAAKKKWMSSTFRRLKTRGKSDARCREIVALHLPRGTGPKDREEVATFSQNEVRACKKSYADSYMDPVKRIQKVMVDMKDQKRELRSVREDLFMVTEARILAQRAEEDRKNVVASISGLALMSKVKDPLLDDGAVSPAQLSGTGTEKQPGKSFARLGEENGMEEEAVADLFREYAKHADSSEMLGRKAFTRLLQAVCPNRTLAESDVDAWWQQMTRTKEDRGSSPGNRRTQCSFAEFVAWFSTSEARAQ